MKLSKSVLAIGLVFFCILLVVVVSPRLAALGSGSGWEFDYAVTSATINGEGFAIDEDEDQTITPTVTYTGGGGGGGGATWLLAILQSDAYHLLIDPDGDPYSNFLLNQHGGLVPNVDFQMSQVWRVDADGEDIAMSAPCDNEIEVGSETWYYYYYAYDVKMQTIARPFTAVNQIGVAFTTAESGSVNAEFVVNVRLQETIFGEVTGEFMDATIKDVRSNLDELLGAQVVYAVYPDASPSVVNSALEIQNREQVQSRYTCTMHIPVSLQNGLTRIDLGQNYVPANVWVSYTILTTLLLKEPLVVGTQGGNLDGGLPPAYTFPFDIRLVLLLVGAGIFVLIAFFIWVRFRNR